MNGEKTSRPPMGTGTGVGGPNRLREALGRLYDQQPPYFREYLRRFKEDPTSRVFAPLAEAYRRIGRLEEAIAICLEGLEHHPDFHGGRVALAKCYLDKKMYVEARAELSRVVQAVPENLLAQRLLGDAYVAARDTQSALHHYKMALLLSPTDVALAEKVHQIEVGISPVIDSRPIEEIDELSAASEKSEGHRSENPSDVTGTYSGVQLESEEDRLPPLWEDTASGIQVPSRENDSDWDGEGKTMIQELGALAEPPPVDDVEVDAILGDLDNPIDDEAFKIEHVSAIFGEESGDKKKEITTETLGDLYFSQGQFDRALRIFEKLKPSPEIARKINACRSRLGVDAGTRIRSRKISVLRGILKRVHSTSARHG